MKDRRKMSKRRKGEDMSSEELLSISNEFSANTKNKLDTVCCL